MCLLHTSAWVSAWRGLWVLPEQVTQQRDRRCHVFCDLAWKAQLFNPTTPSWLPRPSLVNVGRGRGVHKNARRRGSLELFGDQPPHLDTPDRIVLDQAEPWRNWEGLCFYGLSVDYRLACLVGLLSSDISQVACSLVLSLWKVLLQLKFLNNFKTPGNQSIESYAAQFPPFKIRNYRYSQDQLR